jgi:hypothetical protein
MLRSCSARVSRSGCNLSAGWLPASCSAFLRLLRALRLGGQLLVEDGPAIVVARSSVRCRKRAGNPLGVGVAEARWVAPHAPLWPGGAVTSANATARRSAFCCLLVGVEHHAGIVRALVQRAGRTAGPAAGPGCIRKCNRLHGLECMPNPQDTARSSRADITEYPVLSCTAQKGRVSVFCPVLFCPAPSCCADRNQIE